MTAASNTPDNSHRIVLAVEYDGSQFSGWQRQSSPELATVQGSLEEALSQIADRPIQVNCAGRTDAGVHATCQVVHFDSAIDRGEKAWTQGVNSLLPASVRVLWSKRVAEDFHARFSALHRRYMYIVYRRKTASALLAGQLTHSYESLDLDAMNRACDSLLGEQDFSVFRAAGCQSRSPFRNIQHARWFETGPFLVFDVQANAFLQHMVRNMVGSLMAVGRADQPPEWLAAIIASKDRTQAGITAPATGLYLMEVGYEARWQLPGLQYLPPVLEAGNLPD